MHGADQPANQSSAPSEKSASLTSRRSRTHRNEQGKRSYYRVLEIDCSSDCDDATDKLKDVFKSVFFNMATRVVVEGDFEKEETHVAKVVTNLREQLPHLHFTK